MQATAQLFLNTKDAQKDAKQFVDGLKQKLRDIETAADKMTVFKDMVEYIAQVDRALAALRANNKDAFDHMFDGLDANLKKQLEGLFGSSEQLKQLDVLRDKLNNLTPKSSIEEIRKFAKELHDVFTALGATPTFDLDQIKGKGAAKHIETLTDALSNLAVIWKDVNSTISQGFGVGSGGGVAGPSKEVQKEIDKLKKQKEELQETLDAISKGSIKFNLAKDSKEQVEQLRELTQAFKKAIAEKERLEASGAVGTPEYLKRTAEAIKLGAQIRSAFEDEGLTDKAVDWININDDGITEMVNLLFKKLETKNKELVSKIKNLYSDLIVEVDSKLNGLLSGTGAGSGGVSKEYDELNKKVKEYLELKKKLANEEKNSAEYNRIADRQRAIQDEIAALKEIDYDQVESLYGIFDDMDETDISLETALERICTTLKVEVPQSASTGFSAMAQGAESAEKAVVKASKNIMYHLGNLFGSGKARDTFGDMPNNLTEAVRGTRWEQYGFGTLGGGLFGVSDPSTIDQEVKGAKFIQSLDLSKYNMYMANTEERAVALMDFLSKMQKFAMKGAAPDYTGFDAQLQGLDADELYERFKVVFSESELTKDKFNEFINDMVDLLKQAGLHFDAGSDSLSFTNLGDLGDTENISTRFMKMLGYHGVDVGGTSFDGFGQGSVLFDFDKSDIVGYFDTVEDAVRDYQNIVAQIDGKEWVGTTEQLREYGNNIDNILGRLRDMLELGERAGWSPQRMSEISEPIAKLEQVRAKIDETLSQTGGSFVPITDDSVDKAKAKMRELLNLRSEISRLGDTYFTDVDIGKYAQKLDMAKKELDELGAQGLLTADELTQVQKVFDESHRQLAFHEKGYTGYGNGYSSITHSELYDAERAAEEAQARAETAEGRALAAEERAEAAEKRAEAAERSARLEEEGRAWSESRNNELLDENARLEAENEALRERLAQQSDSDDEIDDLQRENGALEERLELLREIADLYGSDINQGHRNRLEALETKDSEEGLSSKEEERYSELSEKISEADEALLEFEQTYERIILTLSNGKKIEILPNDDGLRKLAKIADGYDGEFNGFEIEDVQFVRQSQHIDETIEQLGTEIPAAADKAEQALTEVAAAEEKVKLYDSADVQLSLFEGMTQSAQRAEGEVEELGTAIKEVNNLDGQISLFDKTQSDENVVGDITEEVSELNTLQTTLEDVKNAVIAKTKAFNDEGQIVGQVVGKEIAALKQLSDIVDDITPKVNSLVSGLSSLNKNTNTSINQDVEQTEKKKTTSGFEADRKKQVDALAKYRASIEGADYLTEALKTRLKELDTALRNVGDGTELSKLSAQFENIRKDVDAARNGFERLNLGQINAIEKNLNNAYQKLTVDQKNDVAEEYQAVLTLLERYKINVQDGKKIELDAIESVVAGLRKKIAMYEEANQAIKNSDTAQKKNADFGSTVAINASAKYKTLLSKANSPEFENSSVVAGGIMQLTQAYQKLIDKKNELASKDDITDDDRADFKALTTECNKYAAALEKIIKNSAKMRGSSYDSYMLGSDFVDDKDGRIAALNDFINGIEGADASTIQFKNNWNEAVFAVDNGDGTFTRMTAKFTDARNEIVAMAGDTKKTVSAIGGFIDELKGKFRSISQYFIASLSIYDAWRVIKQGVTYVKEIDSALTELKKVTDATDASYAQFLQDMSKTGAVIGATVADLTTMASEWARLGYSMEEAGKLAESTAILLNVSEFEDATTASEALISTMQAFQYTADESQHVVDILNEVGKFIARR